MRFLKPYHFIKYFGRNTTAFYRRLLNLYIFKNTRHSGATSAFFASSKFKIHSLKYRITFVTLLKCIFFLFFLAGSNLSLAQDSLGLRIALFAPKVPFSTSLIEKTLIELKDYETDTLIFGKNNVININDLLYISENEKNVRLAIDAYALLSHTNSDSLKRIKKDIAKSLYQYDLFLQVNIHQFENFIEYQFLKYKVEKEKLPDSSEDEAANLILIDKKIAVSIFDRNTTVEDLEFKISNSIKELFGNTHAIPKARIHVDDLKLNGSKEKYENKIYAAVKDTIFLDGFFSIDTDTPPDRLKYFWKRITPPDVASDFKLSILQSGIKCAVIPHEAGEYKIELRVEDGIEQSRINPLSKDTLIITVLEKPILHIEPKQLKTFHVQNFIDNPPLDSAAQIITLHSPTHRASVYSEEQRVLNTLSFNADDSLITYFHYAHEPLKQNYRLYIENQEGVHNYTDIKVHHKTYYPYYLGSYWSQSRLSIDSAYQVGNYPRLWNEPKIYLYLRLRNRVDFGLGWAIRKVRWEDSNGRTYQLSSSAEAEVSYKIYQQPKVNLSLDFYLKLMRYQISEPYVSGTQAIGSLKAQANITLFQGLGELGMHMDIYNFLFNQNQGSRNAFITDYHQWFGLGFKVYIPE